MSLGQDLLDVPMGDMIRQMAFAIADAQLQLDTASMRVAEMMSGEIVVKDDDGNPIDDQGNSIVGNPAAAQRIDSRIFFGKDHKGVPEKMSMIELGFTPTFYQFVDTIIEVKIAIRMTRETEYNKKSKKYDRESTHTKRKSGTYGFGSLWGGFKGSSTREKTNSSSMRSTSVDASYSSKYSYSAEGSSFLRTKLVPVPPPTILEERIRTQVEENAKSK